MTQPCSNERVDSNNNYDKHFKSVIFLQIELKLKGHGDFVQGVDGLHGHVQLHDRQVPGFLVDWRVSPDELKKRSLIS